MASNDVPGCETNLVEQVVEPFQIAVNRIDIHAEVDLLNVPQVEFDYAYICGHADKQSFGGSGSAGDRDVAIEWPAPSEAICTKLAPGAVVFLACCHGGLNHVAFDVFIGCDRAETLIGPLSTVDSEVLRPAFHAIIFGSSVGTMTPALLSCEPPNRRESASVCSRWLRSRSTSTSSTIETTGVLRQVPHALLANQCFVGRASSSVEAAPAGRYCRQKGLRWSHTDGAE